MTNSLTADPGVAPADVGMDHGHMSRGRGLRFARWPPHLPACREVPLRSGRGIRRGTVVIHRDRMGAVGGTCHPPPIRSARPGGSGGRTAPRLRGRPPCDVGRPRTVRRRHGCLGNPTLGGEGSSSRRTSATSRRAGRVAGERAGQGRAGGRPCAARAAASTAPGACRSRSCAPCRACRRGKSRCACSTGCPRSTPTARARPTRARCPTGA